jgi:RimJ/RimL family protein N-acetyltransferase
MTVDDSAEPSSPEPVPRYPTDLTCDVALRDGGFVRLRPIAPSDDPAYRLFALGLSPEAIYYRFFSPRKSLTEQEIDHFLHVDYVNRFAVVAVVDPADAVTVTGVPERIVGVGRYDRMDASTDAEVAFVIADDYRENGIATQMLRLLRRAARRNGFDRFVASVLPDNHRMLDVFTESGWVIHRRFEDGVIHVALSLEPATRQPR